MSLSSPSQSRPGSSQPKTKTDPPPQPKLHSRRTGPQLVPQLIPQRPQKPHHSPLALWHLLSLDAPTVATLWTLFIARCSHLILPWTAPAAMFVAVWMIYAADRLLDARVLDIDIDIDIPNINLPGAPHHHPDLEARHRFHHQHRTGFLAIIILGALTLTELLRHLDARALHLYALLATLLAAWMLLIHIRPLPNGTTRRLPKELAVGIFFPAATFIPTLARTAPTAAALHTLGWLANWFRPNLLPAAILFACVCTLNCLCLYAWEHPAKPTQNQAPRVQDPLSSAHSTTRWATAHLTHLALATIALSILTAAICLPLQALTTGLPALACALSASALLTLNTYRNRLTPIHLRAAADLVLLTPILLIPFAR